jgi:UDP-N-acetylmuramoylalanine--D-glutamate ligase
MHKIDIYHDIDIPKEEIHTHLVGDHNLHDIYAAIAACEAIGVDRNEALKHLDSFRGLPHRMEYVGEYNHIRLYNDSIATAQEAVINAVKALEDVDTLILGGMDRGLNYHPLVDFLRNSGVRNIILLPNTTTVFQKLFEEAPYSQKLFPAANMADAVDLAFEKTAEGRICLLSPAAASYGFYKNFEERGKDYCTLIKKHAKI